MTLLREFVPVTEIRIPSNLARYDCEEGRVTLRLSGHRVPEERIQE